MPCTSCLQARQSSKQALMALAKGDIREGATRAKEAAAHVKAKLKGEADAEAKG